MRGRETLKRRLERALADLEDARDRRAPADVIRALEIEAGHAEASLVRAQDAATR